MENRKLIKRIMLWVAGLVAVLILIGYGAAFYHLNFAKGSKSVQWTYYRDSEIKGQVVDVDTRTPIPGAVVIAMWSLEHVFGAGFGGYANIEEVVTDRNGAFVIPEWKSIRPWNICYIMSEIAPEIVIYKPGYTVYSSNKRIRMERPGIILEPPDEAKRRIEKYTLTPAKLQRLDEDEDIYKNFDRFESESHFPFSYYSIKQMKTIFRALEEGVSSLDEKNAKSRHLILKDIKEYKKYWIGGTR